MFKQIIILLVLSLLIIVGMLYAQQGLQFLVAGHDWINEQLTQIFSGGQAGNIIRQLLALLAIPLIVGLVPAIIFWMIRRRWIPCFMEIIWVTWLIQAGALIILYKTATLAI